MHNIRSHSSSYYMPLWPNAKQGIMQRLGPKRAIYIPVGVVLFIILYFAHDYYTVTYPAQLIPPVEYQSTLFSAIQASFPQAMQQNLKHAVQTAPASSDSASSIPNRVFQTDKTPPEPELAKSWDDNGFKRIFLDDDAALEWVESHFGDGEITRSYKSLPKPIL